MKTRGCAHVAGSRGYLNLLASAPDNAQRQVGILVCCVNVRCRCILGGCTPLCSALMSSAVTVTSLLSAWSMEASPVTIGASFTSVTVMVTTDVAVAPKGSVAVTVTVFVGASLEVQLHLSDQLTGRPVDVERHRTRYHPASKSVRRDHWLQRERLYSCPQACSPPLSLVCCGDRSSVNGISVRSWSGNVGGMFDSGA